MLDEIKNMRPWYRVLFLIMVVTISAKLYAFSIDYYLYPLKTNSVEGQSYIHLEKYPFCPFILEREGIEPKQETTNDYLYRFDSGDYPRNGRYLPIDKDDYKELFSYIYERNFWFFFLDVIKPCSLIGISLFVVGHAIAWIRGGFEQGV